MRKKFMQSFDFFNMRDHGTGKRMNLYDFSRRISGHCLCFGGDDYSEGEQELKRQLLDAGPLQIS